MGKGFLDYDAVTTNDLLRTVKENKNRFPLDSDLNEFSEKLLPNSVISREINKIKDATSNNKGYFLNVESLKDAYPTTNEGSKAYVGNSYPYMIYLFQGGEWINSGQAGGDDTFNAGDFYTKLQIDQQREVINGEISRVENGANYEVLEYEINIATTRLKVDEKSRKGGYMITYNPGTGWIKEQYIGELTDNEEWIKDENWEITLEDSGIQAIAENAQKQANFAQINAEEAKVQANYAKEQAQAAQAVVGSIFESAPINTIMQSTEEAGNIFGENWLKCDGRQVSEADYPLLKTKILGQIWENKDNSFGVGRCAYGNGVYVSIGDKKTAISEDGINWNENSIDFDIYDIAYFDGFFYAISSQENGLLLKSEDGKNWYKYPDFITIIGLKEEDTIALNGIYSDGEYLYINIRNDEAEGGVDNVTVAFLKNNIIKRYVFGTDKDLSIGGSIGNLGLCCLLEDLPGSLDLYLVFVDNETLNKKVILQSDYKNYFAEGWIGCEYINGRYIISACDDNNIAIFSTTDGTNLNKIHEEKITNSFKYMIKDNNRLLFFFNSKVYETTDGVNVNEVDIPHSGFYTRGDKMIVITETLINWSINKLELPNIQNHYIKAKQP